MIFGALLMGALCRPCPADAADAYPARPIQIVAPYSAGGDTDLIARIMAKELQPLLKQPVMVVNVVGGAGSIATAKVKNSPPDGYTMLLHHSGVLISTLTGAIDFSFKDMSVLGAVGISEGTVWVTGAQSPYKDMADVVKASKANPGSVKNGVNFGSQSHTHVLAFERAAGVQLHNMDVGGLAEKNVALLGGHIDLSEVQMGTTKAYVDSGRMRVLGTPAAERYADLPNVKTFKEQGIDVSVPDRLFWIGLPPGVPAHVMKTLSDALAKISQSPDIKQELAKLNVGPYFKNAAETTAYLDNENAFLAQYKDVLVGGAKK